MLIETPDSKFVDVLHASPNVEARAGGCDPSILLMHYTGMTCAKKAVDWLSRPEAKVSCHYVIDNDGVITQMVAEESRAWHAGLSHWAGEDDINSASIGIEIQNPGHDDGYPDFPPAQMEAVLKLSRDIVARHNIRPERVLGHSDVAPERKMDPGEKFDWKWLYDNGVGLWVEPEPLGVLIADVSHRPSRETVAQGQALLKEFGYHIEVTGEEDKHSRCVFRAFQRHFRPQRIEGSVDHSSIATAERLLAAIKERVVA